MSITDWLIQKMNNITLTLAEKRKAKLEQQAKEGKAYRIAYSEARVKVAVREAKLDAEYGGHFKRVLATGMKNIKNKIDENKKNREKSGAMDISIPIEAKVK